MGQKNLTHSREQAGQIILSVGSIRAKLALLLPGAKMRASFNKRILATIAFSCLICTVAAIVAASVQLTDNGRAALVEKSRAILSRLEVGRSYVAKMGTLKDVVAETVRNFPTGDLPQEQRTKILKSVPVYAAFELGKEGAEQEHYAFRVFSDNARNSKNQATAKEQEWLNKFRADPNLKEIVEDLPSDGGLAVIRPVTLSSHCMTCHGDPATSPWKNGKDILGIPMENMHEGDLKGAFAVISSLGPVKETVSYATKEMALVCGLFALVAIGFGYWVSYTPLKKVTKATDDLSVSSTNVSEFSSVVSTVSQTLSSGATETAASLEETVASLEELTTMVNRNAEDARAAAQLSQESLKSAGAAEAEVKHLMTSMQDISASSKRIHEIIALIDDMAFQTNLLALNAAVEAARAGEHGKGFAVVADAVRNLAQKSATAAKDIGALVRDSVTRVEKGSQIATNNEKVLIEIVSAIKRIAELNASIAEASREQSLGIDQISKAINQIDQATQQNASGAEEAASSAGKMSKLAENLGIIVKSLQSTIQGEREQDAA